jgi:hypothetical protein
VIHPGQAGDGIFLPIEDDGPAGDQAREGNVVRSMALSRRFLADAVGSVNDGRFFSTEVELEGKFIVDGGQGLRFEIGALPLGLPIAVPDASLREIRSGKRGSGAIETLGV